MNRHRFQGALCVLVLLVASACGDWPWPMNHPDDPLRCNPQCQWPFACHDAVCKYDPCKTDPCSGYGSCSADMAGQSYRCLCYQGRDGDACDRCAVGYTGYPSCHLDPCYQKTCNDHGKCSNGQCRCMAAFSGDECDRCAPGYDGYPDCRCECSAGETACDGRTGIKTCTTACSWTRRSCAQDCQPQDSASFCARSPLYVSDRCYCSSESEVGVVELYLTTTCSSSISAAVYDVTSRASLSDTTTISSSTPFKSHVTCEPNHEICWGAWQGKSYWGCGPECSQPCEDCCTTCPSAGTVVRYPSHSLACQ